MDVTRALSEIAEIHQQIAKGEIYRGYRPLPIAASGVIGLAAAVAQPARSVTDPLSFLRFWSVVAVVAGVIGISEIAYRYVMHEDPSGRRRTRQVLGQFFPAIVAAAVLTLSFVQVSPKLVSLLPGVWAVCFAVGAFASRPYLPRASSLVALYYFVAGSVLLWIANVDAPFVGWHVGGTFGVGQLLAAAILYWQLERDQDRSWEPRRP